MSTGGSASEMRLLRGRGLTAVATGAWAALTCAALFGFGADTAVAAGPTVSGAGSTWVQIALDQWRADIARQGYSINYQGVGSSAGRQFYIINQVDFAATEIPFQPDEVAQLQAEHKSYQYLPDVAGGTSMMYNLHSPSGSRVTSLRLDASTMAGVFTGRITSWTDPAIQALNPGLQLRETTITPVIRSDGSGTSAQFSLYLADQAGGTWNAFVSAYGCPAPCSQWPPFPGSTQQKGSDGVANFVANDAIGSGSIGYVEAGYALGRGFPVASIRNASGNFAQPTSGNVATALTHATLNADLTQNLTGVFRAAEPNVYPMSSYSYMVTQTTGFDPAKGAVLGTWLIYIACAGQREAAPLGYSPLPPNLVQVVFNAVGRIPGAPTPPPIDQQHCPNPNVAASGGAAAAAARAAAAAAARGTTAAQATGPIAGASTSGPGGYGGSLGGLKLPTGVDVATLDAGQRKALFAQAERTVSEARLPASTPLLVAAIVVMLAVFLPAVIRLPGGRR